MGFLELDIPVPLPSAPPPEATAIPDSTLYAWLSGHDAMDPDEAAELSGLAPLSAELKDSGIALVAALVETDIPPQHVPAVPGDFPASIGLLFETATNTARDLALAYMDIPPLRLLVVAAGSLASFATVDIASLSLNGPGREELVKEVDHLLCEYLASRNRYHTIHLVLRLRGGGGPLEVGEPASDFLQGDVRFEERTSELVQGAEALATLLAKNGPITRQLARLTRNKLCNVRRSGSLVFGSQLVLGRWLRPTTYALDSQGSIHIYERSRVPRDRPEVEKSLGATASMNPEVTAGVKTTQPGLPSREISGEAAVRAVLGALHDKVKLRKWFLSKLLTGEIFVDKDSTADGFIPPDVPRKTGMGLRLDKVLPAFYFAELGGTVATIGNLVLFRAFRSDRPRRVKQIAKDGTMKISDCTLTIEEVETAVDAGPRRNETDTADSFPMRSRAFAYHWDMRGLRVGHRDWRLSDWPRRASEGEPTWSGPPLRIRFQERDGEQPVPLDHGWKLHVWDACKRLFKAALCMSDQSPSLG